MPSDKFRLRNMKVTRVDLVDRGANQDAHIVLAKADAPAKTSDLASRIKEFMASRSAATAKGAPGQAPGAPAPGGGASPLGREKGSGSRIVRLNPADFEVVNSSGNMMEWAIPEDKLPEGVEEAMMTMVQSGDTPMFQWLIDPLAGPPVEGTAKTAAEAFVAMRGALTTQGAMDPAAMLGGLPGQPAPGGAPGGAPASKPNPAAPRLAKRIKVLKAAKKPVEKPVRKADEVLQNTLDLIAKGLVEVNVFADTATGEDLRDILPTNLLGKITDELSATSAE